MQKKIIIVFFLVYLSAKYRFNPFSSIISLLHNYFNNLVIPVESLTCDVPEWNRINTKSVPHAADFKRWASSGVGAYNYLQRGEARLLSAFVYKDQISIVTTAENIDRKSVSCRYYDCNRQEISDSAFNTIVAPMAVITCPRRFGAVYMSISFIEGDKPHEPIPLIYRVYDEPIHELSVCVGPLYGNSSKWLEIVEYVEHYKLIGVSFFYFTLFNMNEYDHKIVSYYSKFGYAEYTHYVMEYKRLHWMFHVIQTQECHFRSRSHSKWVINVDIDERLVYTDSDNLLHFLRTMPPEVGELSFAANRVLKYGKMPQKLKKFPELESQMMFLKFNKTTEISWYNFKGIIRPELVFVLFYHWSFWQESNVHVVSVPKRIAHIRHYRTMDVNGLNGDWLIHYNGTLHETRFATKFEENLIQNVKEKVKYVYQQK